MLAPARAVRDRGATRPVGTPMRRSSSSWLVMVIVPPATGGSPLYPTCGHARRGTYIDPRESLRSTYPEAASDRRPDADSRSAIQADDPGAGRGRGAGRGDQLFCRRPLRPVEPLGHRGARPVRRGPTRVLAGRRVHGVRARRSRTSASTCHYGWEPYPLSWLYFAGYVALGWVFLRRTESPVRIGAAALGREPAVLPRQQLRELAGTGASLRVFARRASGLLRRRDSVLPRHVGRRPGLHRGPVRRARGPEPGVLPRRARRGRGGRIGFASRRGTGEVRRRDRVQPGQGEGGGRTGRRTGRT